MIAWSVVGIQEDPVLYNKKNSIDVINLTLNLSIVMSAIEYFSKVKLNVKQTIHAVKDVCFTWNME